MFYVYSHAFKANPTSKATAIDGLTALNSILHVQPVLLRVKRVMEAGRSFNTEAYFEPSRTNVVDTSTPWHQASSRLINSVLHDHVL